MEMVYLVVEEVEDMKHEIVFGIFKCIGRTKCPAKRRFFYKVAKGSIVVVYSALWERKATIREHTLITKGDLGIEVKELPYDLYKTCKELEGYPKYEIKREKHEV